MLISVASAAGIALIGAVATLAVQRSGDAFWPSRGGHDSAGLPSTAPAGLVINARWPPELNLTCDHDVNVAGLPGSPGIDQFPTTSPGELSADRDPRTIAVQRLGAITWFRGELRLALTTTSPESILILGVEPTVFSRKPIVPAWGLEFDPPCGGPAQYRLFRAVLDRASIEDLGVIGREGASGSPYKDAPASPLGRTFTVSQNDPAELVFHVYACSGYFEWGLKITYIAAGQSQTAWVGTRDRPLRAVGGWRDVARYHGNYNGQTVIAPGPAAAPGASLAPGPPASATSVCPR